MDVLNVTLRCFFAESDSLLIIVDLLTICFFIHSQPIMYQVTIPLVCLEEDQAVFCEEDVGNHRATSGNFDPL